MNRIGLVTALVLGAAAGAAAQGDGGAVSVDMPLGEEAGSAPARAPEWEGTEWHADWFGDLMGWFAWPGPWAPVEEPGELQASELEPVEPAELRTVEPAELRTVEPAEIQPIGLTGDPDAGASVAESSRQTRPAGAKEAAYAEALAAELGLAPGEARGVRFRWSPDATVGIRDLLEGSAAAAPDAEAAPSPIRGVEVALDGLTVRRYRFPDAARALAWAARAGDAMAEGEHRIVEVRGAQAVLASGPRLDDSAFGARVRRAAWGTLPAPAGHELLAVTHGEGDFAAETTVGRGPLHEAIAKALEASRERRTRQAEHERAAGERGEEPSMTFDWRGDDHLRVTLQTPYVAEIQSDAGGGWAGCAPEAAEVDRLLAYLERLKAPAADDATGAGAEADPSGAGEALDGAAERLRGLLGR